MLIEELVIAIWPWRIVFAKHPVFNILVSRVEESTKKLGKVTKLRSNHQVPNLYHVRLTLVVVSFHSLLGVKARAQPLAPAMGR